jgi:hypothetical protein
MHCTLFWKMPDFRAFLRYASRGLRWAEVISVYQDEEEIESLLQYSNNWLMHAPRELHYALAHLRVMAPVKLATAIIRLQQSLGLSTRADLSLRPVPIDSAAALPISE